MKHPLTIVLALVLAGGSSALGQQGSTQVIAITGTAAPGLGANFSGFGDAVINGSGTIAFVGNAGTGKAAVYETAAGALVTIASTGQSAPFIGGTFTGFASPLLNENGTVAFLGNNGGFLNSFATTGIYTGNGGALTAIAATGQSAPSIGGPVTTFGTASLTDSGIVAFKSIVSDGPTATVTPTGIFAGTGGGTAGSMSVTTIATMSQTAPGIGGLFTGFGDVVQNTLGFSAFTGTSSNGTAIYTSMGGSLFTIATSAQEVPVIGGNFTLIFNPALNDRGTVAFAGVTANGRGIFTGSGGALTPIATTSSAAPGLTGNFTNFFETLLSNSGAVVFRGIASNGSGIYSGSGGTLQTVASTTQAAPVIGGNFSAFSKLTVNDIGTVAFLGTSSSAGSPKGLYLGDGQELVTAAYIGQSVDGSTITSLTFVGGVDRGGASQINNNGQVTYRATLANAKTAVMLFTPTLRFRNSAGGSWAANNNWTVGILPASVHDVLIDPATSLTASGPISRTTVKSLTVNGTGTGIADLALQSGGVISATNGITVGSSGRVSGTGKLIANVSNGGVIAPGLASSAGSLSVIGNLTLQPTSRLAFDIGGLTPKTGYDFLNVSGIFGLGGTFDLSLTGGFTPLAGSSFGLFQFTSSTGSFSQINLPALSGGLGWNTALFSTSGVLSVISTGPVVATWNLTGSGSWASAANWLGGIPNGIGAQASFGGGPGILNSPATITVSGAKTVGTIIFNSSSSYEVTGAATDTVTLDNGTATPSITVLTGSHTLTAPIILAQDTEITANASTALAISGVVSGTRSLTLNAPGLVTLSSASTYTGATTVTAGTLKVDGSTAAASTVAVGTAGTLAGGGTIGGSATLTGSGAINLGPTGIIAGTLGVTGGAWNGAGSVTGPVTATSGSFNIGPGANLTAPAGLSVTGGTLSASGAASTITASVAYTSTAPSTFGGIIAGAGKTLSLNAPATTLTLSGANTYTGATTVTAGTLKVDGSTAAGSTVAVGTAGTLAGSGTIGGSATVTGSGAINLAPTGLITGTLGVTGGAWNGAGSVTGPVTATSGSFNIGPGANLTAPAGLSVTGGTLSAADAASTITASVAYTSTAPSTFGGIIAGTGKTLTLNAPATTLTLSGASTYTGATTVAQGTLSAASIVVSAGASNLGNATSAVVLGGAAGLGSLAYTGSTATFTRGFEIGAGGGKIETSTGGQTLTVASGAISASGPDTSLTIAGAGNTTISSAVLLGAASGALTKTGTGTLSLSGAQGYRTLTASAGTTNLNGSFTGGTATVNANATTNIGASQTLSALNIGSGTTVTFTQSPAAFGGGSAVVPEPGSLSLLVLGALGVLARRRRD